MKRLAFIIIFLAVLAGAFLMYISDKENTLPQPFETIVIEKDEDAGHHMRKQKWIEEMHRSAPEDNWRYMDQLYRYNNQRTNHESRSLPISGKWRELGSNNQAGRTVYTHLDRVDDLLYVASDGGQIWKGSIGAEDWYSITDHYKIPAIRFISQFRELSFTRLFVHSSAWNSIGIHYSDDDGQNWQLASGLNSIVSWGFIKKVAVRNDSNKTIYCISQEWDYSAWQAISKVYKSSDLGESFVAILEFDHGVDQLDIWTSQKAESPVYVIDQGEFYYIDPDNDELVYISTLPNSENGNTLLTAFNTGNDIFFYTMIRYQDVSHFFASSSNGQNWAETGFNAQGPFMQNSFTASVEQKDVLYYGGIEAFYSMDAGASWTKVNSWGQYYGSPHNKLHADMPAFNPFLDDGGSEVLFINTDGGTYVSTDNMQTVENLSLNNLRISQYYSSYTCRFNPSITHTGSQDQGYQRSFDGMEEDVIDYDQIISGDYGNMVSGDGGASIWMVYPGFVMYGPNINNTTALILEDFVGSNYQWLPKLMEDPDDPEKVYLAGGRMTGGAHIMHLQRVGSNIEYTELPFDFSEGTNANISAMAYSKINTDHRYVMTSERDFFYSTDAGESWTHTPAFSGPASHYFYGASIAPANTDLNTVYIAGSGYSNPGVYRSTDGGNSFVDFSDGLPESMVFQIALTSNDSLLFAATDIGAFVCKTWEETWHSLADSVIPDQSFWAVDYVDTLKVMRFSTYGRGVWDFELDPEIVVGIPEVSSNYGFEVFPNPARSSVHIRHTPSVIVKHIEIYNLQGEQVLKHVTDKYEFSIDISSFSNGLYFIQLHTDMGILVEKLIVN